MPLTDHEQALLAAALRGSDRDPIDLKNPRGPQRDSGSGDPSADLLRLIMSGMPLTVEALRAAGVPVPPGYVDDNSEGVPR